jgi:hypothetical protein
VGLDPGRGGVREAVVVREQNGVHLGEIGGNLAVAAFAADEHGDATPVLVGRPS